MKQWRVTLLVVLLVLPVLALMGFGSYFLWTTQVAGMPAWLVIWWPLAGCMSLAIVLAWWWQRKNRLFPGPELAPQLHWTERDHAAWKLVSARADTVGKLDSDKLLEVQFYSDTAFDMAAELARHYHPKSKDPFGPLTIPEMLAVCQLASEDLTELVNTYLPGGHLLTIDHYRTASKVTDWYSYGSAAYWIAAALYSPINTAARFLASKAGVSRPLDQLGQNLKEWFFRAFVNRVGHYLIELNSGRLRVGAKRYRELLGQTGGERRGLAPPASRETSPAVVRLAVVGKVKAGKSSLINALLGARRAQTDVLPLTNQITRYHLTLNAETGSNELLLLDTVGYSHEGPKADQLRATFEAVHQSDVVLLVLHARDPGRQPDVGLLQKLTAWLSEHPEHKAPPCLAVLTHIDLLSPSLEWSPPYDYLNPQKPKEQSIAGAVAAVREQLSGLVADVIPVCTAEGRVFGVQEWLLPNIVARLDEGRAVALLRCLYAEADEGKVRRVFEQILAAGSKLFRG